MEPDPGLNPIDLYTLVVTLGAESGVGNRAYLCSDPISAQALANRIKDSRPTEATVFEYKILQLEGPPS